MQRSNQRHAAKADGRPTRYPSRHVHFCGGGACACAPVQSVRSMRSMRSVQSVRSVPPLLTCVRMLDDGCRHLAETKGCVVNISSISGQCSDNTGVVYAMNKAAIDHMTRYLAVEWADQGVRVNAVAPWFIETPLTAPVSSNAMTSADAWARQQEARAAGCCTERSLMDETTHQCPRADCVQRSPTHCVQWCVLCMPFPVN